MTAPNVLLVVLDSVRARNTSVHDHIHDTMPFVRSLAGESATVYEQARAPGVWSLPSHASMFSGYHVAEHQLTERDRRLAASESIWTDLEDEGYHTGLFTGNPYLTELPVGLDAGFETVRGSQDIPYPDALNPREFVHEHGQGQFTDYLRACLDSGEPLRGLLNGVSEKLEQDAPWLYPDSLRSRASASTYTEQFLDWQAEADGPWAACINFMDPHTPYMPGPDHDHWGGERLQALQAEMDNQVWEFYGGQRPWWQITALAALYDGAIHRADAQIRRIVETLRRGGEFEDTLLVITGDHGEGFGERCNVRPGLRVAGHQARGIDETLLHVPLVVKHPGQDDPDRVCEVASLTEFPTVVRSALDGDCDGTEFSPDGPVIATSYGLDEQKAEMGARYCDDLERFRGTAHAVYQGRGDEVIKYVTWGDNEATLRIYDAQTAVTLSRDGGDRVREVVDGTEQRDVLETGDSEGLTDNTKARLEDLGYV